MEPLNASRNRRSCFRFLGALVAAVLLLVLAVYIPNNVIRFVSLCLAFGVAFPLTIVFYASHVQPQGNPQSARVPRKLAIPVIFFGAVALLPSGFGLVIAICTRDETFFNVRSIVALSLTFIAGLFVIWWVLRRNVGFVRALRFRFSLRTLLVVALVVPPVIFVGWRLIVILPVRRAYEECRTELTGAITEISMDAATERFLADVRENWTERSNELNGIYGQALQALDRSPSVQNLVDFLTYQMPPFSLVAPQRNYRPAVIGMFQAQILPRSEDGYIHVSEDRSVALIRVHPKEVFLFENEAPGMRETVWVLRDVNRQGDNDGPSEEP